MTCEYDSIIKLIDNPTEKAQLEIIKKNPMALQYILEKGIVPTEAVILTALECSSLFPFHFHQLMKNNIYISKEIQIEIVRRHPSLIKYIKDPCEDVQLEAIKNADK